MTWRPATWSDDEPTREFVESSVVYRLIADFPDLGRTIYVMNRESVRAMAGSLGNVIFKFTEPVLRLRDSDRQLLLAAVRGATDPELAIELNLLLAALQDPSSRRVQAVNPC